jgi:hypothetical protein
MTRRTVLLLSTILFVGLGSGMLACNDPAKITPPPACDACFTSQDALIQGLATAYGTLNYEDFQGLFTASSDSADYYYFLNEPINGVTNWNATEEWRIHRRMFKPRDPLPGETPVPSELWLNSITISLDQISASWTERTDLYRSDVNPQGLDPGRWRATEAEHHADVLWRTQGYSDYRVNGRVNFVVVEDLHKETGAARKFLIYRWEDLGNFGIAIDSQPATWSNVKSLYR